MLRIVIADDHEIVRRGLRTLIDKRAGWVLCGEASDGQAAVELTIREKPDVVVLDVSMPLMNGIAVTRRLRQAAPETKVLLFTMHEDEDTISAGLAAGARGYIFKSDGDSLLDEAIFAVASDRPFFSSAVSELLLAGALHERRKSLVEGFTNRELEIAQHIAEGKSNKQIARILTLSVKTVESHRAAAMRKAGVHTTAQLVRFAIQHRLIQA